MAAATHPTPTAFAAPASAAVEEAAAALAAAATPSALAFVRSLVKFLLAILPSASAPAIPTETTPWSPTDSVG
jgi:hypothetical protein